MLEKYLVKLFKNKNYSFSYTKINYIKENEDLYIVYLTEKIQSNGRPLVYRINKKDGKNEPIFLPDNENFKFLKNAEKFDFVNIPEKFKDKYF